MGTSTRVGKYIEHAEYHPSQVRQQVMRPANESIHSGRMSGRRTPTTNTPTTSSGKIWRTKRHVFPEE
jgi:hypothetical protein